MLWLSPMYVSIIETEKTKMLSISMICFTKKDIVLKEQMLGWILSYICYKNKITLPHIAAGVNLSFFPMGTIFRHSGAFFIRRTFKGKKLYTSVFKQYLKTLVADSYLLEFFVEGGRTRTGRLVFPKMGIINYLVEAIDENYNKDLIFLPISINYDRVPEESSYIKEKVAYLLYFLQVPYSLLK